MASIIFLLIIISLDSIHTSMVDASWNVGDRYSVGQKAQVFKMGTGDRRENRIGEVSELLDRFRVLLGFNSFHKIPANGGGAHEYGSPSLSPLPSSTAGLEVGAPAPAPAPALKRHVHVPSPHRPPHWTKSHTANMAHEHDKGNERRKKILVAAALVTIGSTLVICSIVFIWASQKYYKHRKKQKNAIAQKLASKVTHDPGYDLFYIETLATVLEPQPCIKKTSNYLVASSVQNSSSCTLHDIEDLENELQELEPGEGSSSPYSAEEIISIHEYPESEGRITISGDQVILNESQLSVSDGEESFYSLCYSQPSPARFSNASLESFSDVANCFSPGESSTAYHPLSSKQVLHKVPTSNSELQKNQETQKSPNYQNNSKIMPSSPPPLPPPPPPPPPPLSSSYSIHSLKKPKFSMPSKESCPGNLDPFSGSGQSSGSCLPQAPKIHDNSLKGQPPPPPSLPPFTLQAKNGAPLRKLKPLHWDKVRALPDQSTVWDKLSSSSFRLDEEMIESLFGYNLQSAFGDDEGKNKTPSPSKHVLEPKRLQNITILSKALNVTAEQVCNALLQGDGLSLQQLEALTKMALTKEEEDKLSNYKGDVNELGSAEKLVRGILSITFAFQRIEAMLFKATFEDEVVHLRNSFSILEEASKELRSSRLFLKLLEAVLKTGNRMNVGTIRGGARAFKLDALLKLADVKGTDGKTTLLHFVVQEIVRSEGIRMSDSIIGKINQSNKSRTAEEREEDYRRMGLELVSGLGAELYNVKKTATIDLDVLASSVTNLSDGMSKLQKLISKDLCNNATAGNFLSIMNMFMSHAETNLKELRRHEDAVLQSVRDITEYFHGNVSKDEVNPLRIFVIVRDFLGMLDQVCRELRTQKTPRSPNPLAPFC